LYINNAFGVGLQGVFKEEFERLGGKVVATEAFAQASRDARAQLIKIMKAGVQGTYLIGYEEMVGVFRQAKELGLRTQWLATTFLNDQDLVNKMGGAADGCIFAAWDYSPDSQDPRVREFAEKVRQRTGGLSADVFAANAYDAVYLLCEAMKRKGTTSDAIRDGLYSIQDYDGVTGKTSFDRNGDVIKPVRIKTIVDGKIQPLKS
jgi:branched-chain amino acid transport system substrate-binding protein